MMHGRVTSAWSLVVPVPLASLITCLARYMEKGLIGVAQLRRGPPF